MTQAQTVLIVEDSQQDFEDVRAYVQIEALLQGKKEGRDYTIERATERDQAVRSLKEHEEASDRLIVIFDIHIDRTGDDLTDLIASLIKAPKGSWRAELSVIVWSQYAAIVEKRLERHGVSKSMLADRRKRGKFSAVSKTSRSEKDPRAILSERLSSALKEFSTLKGAE